jgi:uncharacterized protein (DUF427 family)
VADTVNALLLQEADYPPVPYVPRADVDMSALERSTHSTICPFKGTASYFDLADDGKRAANAVWSYESPHDAVRDIEAYLAFYPSHVAIGDS